MIALATDRRMPLATRLGAAHVLFEYDHPASQQAIADALDPVKWDGKDGIGAGRNLWRVYRTGARAMARIDPALAYDRLAELFTVEAVKKRAGYERADAALNGIQASGAIDARWNSLLLPLLKTKLKHRVLMVLAEAPLDPRVVEPICGYLGKTPEKVGYFDEHAIEILARNADARAVPYLAAALRDNWMHFPRVFEGFRRAGDPAMAPVIRAWLAKNGDGPTGERTKLGCAVAEELEAKR